ncbi:MAG: hypothetical protein QM765_37295 [Myxococcales bacterium]
MLAGRYDALQDLRFDRIDRLVFVCLGNICRSPFAEAVARSLGADATSYGLRATDGRHANPLAVQAARTRSIELGAHRSRRQVELRRNDSVIAVEPAHLSQVRAHASTAGAQASLLGLWAFPAQPHIEDPFGLSPEYFDTCFAVIDDAVRRLVKRVGR